MGSGDVQGLVPSLGMGDTHPEPDRKVTTYGWGVLQPLVPSLGLVSPTPEPAGVVTLQAQVPSPLHPTGPRWTHKHQHVEDEHQVLHAGQNTHGDTRRGETAVLVPMEGRAGPWPQPVLTCPGPHGSSRMWGMQPPKIPRSFSIPTISHDTPKSPKPMPSPNPCPLPTMCPLQTPCPQSCVLSKPASPSNPVSPPNLVSPTNSMSPPNPCPL